MTIILLRTNRTYETFQDYEDQKVRNLINRMSLEEREKTEIAFHVDRNCKGDARSILFFSDGRYCNASNVLENSDFENAKRLDFESCQVIATWQYDIPLNYIAYAVNMESELQDQFIGKVVARELTDLGVKYTLMSKDGSTVPVYDSNIESIIEEECNMSNYRLYGEKLIEDDSTLAAFARSIMKNISMEGLSGILQDEDFQERYMERVDAFLMEDISRTDIQYPALMQKYADEIGSVLCDIQNWRGDLSFIELDFFGEGAEKCFNRLVNEKIFRMMFTKESEEPTRKYILSARDDGTVAIMESDAERNVIFIDKECLSEEICLLTEMCRRNNKSAIFQWK